jgi:hypothetical protein
MGCDNIPTPELDKMLAVKDQSNALGEFLEWMGSKGLWICRSATKEDDITEGTLLPVYKSTEVMLAEYFGIDLNKAEKEKRAVLEELQKKMTTERIL